MVYLKAFHSPHTMLNSIVPLRLWLVLATFLFVSLNGIAQNPKLEAGEGYVEVEGGKMWYRIIGEGNATPLLMMHGGPGGTSHSLTALGALSIDRPLIIFDQLGGGRSDVHQDTILLTVDHFVEQVYALVSHLDLNECFLYGHSWGTALSLEYYTKYPNGVVGIIFNSPFFNTAEWIADADTLIMALHDTLQDIIRDHEMRQDYDSEAFRQAERIYLSHYGLRSGKRVQTEWDMPYKPGNGFIYKYMWGETEFTATGKLKTYDRSDALTTIDVPALFITGEYDEARPPTVKRQAASAPQGEFAVIESAGHASMHDNNEDNVAVIRAFLERHDR